MDWLGLISRGPGVRDPPPPPYFSTAYESGALPSLNQVAPGLRISLPRHPIQSSHQLFHRAYLPIHHSVSQREVTKELQAKKSGKPIGTQDSENQEHALRLP